jgi:hypothetical protein
VSDPRYIYIVRATTDLTEGRTDGHHSTHYDLEAAIAAAKSTPNPMGCGERGETATIEEREVGVLPKRWPANYHRKIVWAGTKSARWVHGIPEPKPGGVR